METKKLQKEQYTVGWICALPIELAASVKMLDEEHSRLPQDPVDHNSYRFGRIGEHNIVIGCLPAGQTGLVSAASVAMQMKSSFTSIRMGLMVGIGGGVPGGEADIRLGDVVVSQPYGQYGGAVQYDLGKTGPTGKLLRTGLLNSPPPVLLTALTDVKAAAEMEELNISAHLSRLARILPKFAVLPNLQDKLYKPTYLHQGGSNCLHCQDCDLVQRDERDGSNPVIHYGTIASGNQVIKDAVARDKLSQDLGGVLCFEMEAAGLMNNFPCLVIRGISDYADSHKNDGWQRYASATAAAFAKELLMHVAASSLVETQTVNESMKQLTKKIDENTEATQRVESRMMTKEEGEILQWLSTFSFDTPQHESRSTKMDNTGLGLMDHPKYRNWRDRKPGLLWLHGVAGCGKTILCSTAIHNLQQLCQQPISRKRLAYWYFQFSNSDTQDVCKMLRSLIRQLSSSPLPPKVRKLWDQHKAAGSNPDLGELTAAFNETVHYLEEEVIIVVDALDECPDQKDKKSEREKLLGLIQSHFDCGPGHLRLLVTSRRENDIDNAIRDIRGRSIINIEELVGEDIAQFVRDALTKEPLSYWRPEVQDRIKQRLLEREKRFRWADLQIKRLQKCPDEDDLLGALASLPQTLEETYEEALQRTPKDAKKYVRRILIWLATSLYPLTITELAAAARFANPSFVWGFCSSLLVTIIDDECQGATDQIVKLAHFSVQEFLVVQQIEDKGILWYKFSSQLAHRAIAADSISYLLDQSNESGAKAGIFSQEFLEYAAEFWPQHATTDYNPMKESHVSFEEKEMYEKIDILFDLEHPDPYFYWLGTFDHDRRYRYKGRYRSSRDYTSPLYYASLLGLERTTKEMLERVDIVENEGIYGNAINAAAIKGHFRVVQQLREKLPQASTIVDLSAIVRNLERSPQKTLGILLDWLEGDSITEEIVQAAAGNERSGVEVITLLLDRRGADVVITEMVVEAAAGSYKGKEIITLLLDRQGADVVITEKVVEAAAGNEDSGEEIITLLLDRQGADVVITEKVVEAAAGNEDSGEEIITLLLDRRGADVVITEEVVKAAAGNEYSGKEVITLLLDRRGAEEGS